ncbi:MAG TPA: N-acetyltransferase family protein [Povalibacter sp.]|uniref:GNAT family N-acetyltransferase n=1 Tax=Povalibacter sp. TaxID=1962978 RepID=UPI002B92863B|nr:GNAT family N-acetyltransferase [Povalibacter sp.]HMN43853.1 N-acetyltransferase family protein [Povalibacter sp.]
MKIVTCTLDAHGAAILDIFNDAILNTTALYDYKPRTAQSMTEWFEVKRAGDFPVIGAVNDDGVLLGFASYGKFRPHAAYKYSVEHSIYIHHKHRGKGLAPLLMQQLIDAARQQNYHLMVGGIDATNTTSIRLHEKLGFTHAGTISQAGFKFGRWLDLAFYQLILETPAQPADG